MDLLPNSHIYVYDYSIQSTSIDMHVYRQIEHASCNKIALYLYLMKLSQSPGLHSISMLKTAIKPQ